MGHKYVCDYCGKEIGIPHYGLDGKQDGYEVPGFFNVTISLPRRKETWDFCGYACLAEWINTRLPSRFESWRKKDATE